MRIPCQKTWESTVGNGQQAKQNQRSSFHSIKQQTQDHVLYTNGSVTKDQSGWVFTVKQDATTIHEDSAACTVSTFSLTMDMEEVTHALHRFSSGGDSQTTHAITFTDSMSLLQKGKSGMESQDRNVSMVDIHLRKLLWVHCPGHAGVQGND